MEANQFKRSSIRKQRAILSAQALSYGLIVTFIFANAKYGLIGSLVDLESPIETSTPYFAACLIGIVGAISLWLTWHYATKSNSMRDMLVICAWTNRVKSNGQWISLEAFFTDQLGYAVSHGLSDAKLVELRRQVDDEWRNIDIHDPMDSDSPGGVKS